MRSTDPLAPNDLRSQARSLLLGDRQGVGAPAAENWRQSFPEIVGRSVGMQRVLETVAKVARSDSSVLILGASGTGKELIASAIHRLSNRSDRPYVTLNSSAIPENLLESELFGHERGAYTGADRRRIGRFEEAKSGTLFLDEIGDMPLPLQAKLLRVLQDKKYTPLGGNETKEADVRIVAATNADLQTAVDRGTFRLDLFYRLNVLPIHLPALRDRSEDVADLLEHFVEISNRSHGVSAPCYFAPESVRILMNYEWPGNIRQLQNLVERLVVMKGGGAIQPDDLPPEVRVVGAGSAARNSGGLRITENVAIPLAAPLHTANVRYPEPFAKLPHEGLDLVAFIEGLENDYIRQALERTNNNRNQAAKLLGLNRTTLVERIKKRKITALNEPSKEL